MIEIPIPIELLKPESSLNITFPDSEGKVACAIVQTNLLEPVTTATK